MKVFGFHIAKNLWQMMATPFQLPKIYNLFKSLAFPLNSLMLQFEAFQKSVNKQVSYNSQTIYLERGLNDTFNPGHNGIFDLLNNNIYIETHPGGSRIYEFTEAEIESDAFEDLEAETWVDDNFNYLDAEPGAVVLHYTVHVPSALSLNLIEVRGLINKYNPVGKYFTVITY